MSVHEHLAIQALEIKRTALWNEAQFRVAAGDVEALGKSHISFGGGSYLPIVTFVGNGPPAVGATEMEKLRAQQFIPSG